MRTRRHIATKESHADWGNRKQAHGCGDAGDTLAPMGTPHCLSARGQIPPQLCPQGCGALTRCLGGDLVPTAIDAVIEDTLAV